MIRSRIWALYRAAIGHVAQGDPVYAAELVALTTAVGRGLTPGRRLCLHSLFHGRLRQSGRNGTPAPDRAANTIRTVPTLCFRETVWPARPGMMRDATASTPISPSCRPAKTLMRFISTTPDTDVFRFFNPASGEHFFTSSQDERNQIIGQGSLTFEGTAFETGSTAVADTAVFRFFNTVNGTHLFTASSGERDALDHTPGFIEEGVGFYAYGDLGGGTHAPVYRFFDTASGNHFFTASEAERQAIQGALPTFHAEGIAYYVDPPQINAEPHMASIQQSGNMIL